MEGIDCRGEIPGVTPVVVGSLKDLVTFTREDGPDACCIVVRPSDPGLLPLLAWRLAVDIASRLTTSSAEAFSCWFRTLLCGEPNDQPTREELEAYLLADFKPCAEGTERVRLCGAVVEHLWASLAPYLDGGLGVPIYVAHDHFSVIDHGGDGVSVYGPSEQLSFRLWESKQHASVSTSVTTKVTKAAKQLKANGGEYLARLSKVLQVNPDLPIAELGGRIVKIWTSGGDQAAVGVSVGRTDTGALPARPFKHLHELFPYPQFARREGVVLEIPSLFDFAKLVQAAVLKGIG